MHAWPHMATDVKNSVPQSGSCKQNKTGSFTFDAFNQSRRQVALYSITIEILGILRENSIWNQNILIFADCYAKFVSARFTIGIAKVYLEHENRSEDLPFQNTQISFAE